MAQFTPLFMSEIYMVIGFLMAAYAIVGNDSIQTLGTFLYSNSHRPWWVLWLFSSTIMVGVILFGWNRHDGDPSYQRLNKIYSKTVSESGVLEELAALEALLEADASGEAVGATGLVAGLEVSVAETKSVFVKHPQELDSALAQLEAARAELLALRSEPTLSPAMVGAIDATAVALLDFEEQLRSHRDVSDFIGWQYLLPPIALLFLTRFGYPVSTSFLILITFQPAVFGSMMTKSFLGYLVAFGSALLVYTTVMRLTEKRWRDDGERGIKPIWVVFQWLSTGVLWSMWLIQDMANIFVYLPRRLEVGWLVFALVWMVVIQGIIYFSHGGKIQQVVQSKSNTHDVRSATIVDLIYGIVLYIFKIQSNVPMSTTWVFLGLLAGRELAFAFSRADHNFRTATLLMGRDLYKAAVGLGVSVVLALVINLI